MECNKLHGNISTANIIFVIAIDHSITSYNPGTYIVGLFGRLL